MAVPSLLLFGTLRNALISPSSVLTLLPGLLTVSRRLLPAVGIQTTKESRGKGGAGEDEEAQGGKPCMPSQQTL